MSKFNIRDNAGLKAAVTWVRAIENKHGTLLWENSKGVLRARPQITKFPPCESADSLERTV